MVINPPFNFWDVPAALISGLGLVFGLRLAYFGRMARGKWKQLVEAVVMTVITSTMVTLVFLIRGQPPQPQLAAAIGLVAGIAAYIISGQYESRMYGFVGAMFGVALAMICMWLFPIELFGLGGALVAIGFVLGFNAGVGAHKLIVIFTTGVAGAQGVATSLIGVVLVMQGKSWDFISDRLLDMLVPVINLLIDFWNALRNSDEMLLFVGGLAIQAVVTITGIGYQLSMIHVTPAGATNLKVWLKQSVRKVIILGSAGTLAYSLLFYWFRVHQ